MDWLDLPGYQQLPIFAIVVTKNYIGWGQKTIELRHTIQGLRTS